MFMQNNGKDFKQLHGTAIGSPVSVVVAEIVMQNIEEQALATYKQTVLLWLRYVDNTFAGPLWIPASYLNGLPCLNKRHLSIFAVVHKDEIENTSTDKTLTYTLKGRLKKMVRFLI